MFLVVTYQTADNVVISKGTYDKENGIPKPATGQAQIKIENPDQALVDLALEKTAVVSDSGTMVIQEAVDTRPFCKLIMGRDPGSGFVTAWDPNHQAFVFEVGETIQVQGTLAIDQALTQLVPVAVSFRTPIVRNEMEDKVVLLSFDNGVANRSLTIGQSGIYRIMAEHAYKVQLLGQDGTVVNEIKIIVAE